MSFSYISILFQLNSYGPTMGTVETQPTDWIIPPAPHHHLVNNSRQRWVYFCGEFSCPLDFLQMFHSYDTIFSIHHLGSYHVKGWNSAYRLSLASHPHNCFSNNNMQQQIYFCGEFSCPLEFLQILHSYVENVLIKSLQSYRGNSRNSAHTLSLASCPTPPPCQQQQAGVGIFLWWVFMSFTLFIDVVLLCLRRKLNLSAMVLPRRTAETQFTDWVRPPALHHCFTTLRAAAGIFLCWVFRSISFFTNFFIAMLHIFFI